MRVSGTDRTYDVVICGAGPVGLFLACELALAKCSVLILEKEANPDSPLKKMPFGIRGLSAPTIEAFDRRGLFSELMIHRNLKTPHQAQPNSATRRPGGHFAGITFLESDVDQSRWRSRLPSSTATNLISEMHEVETILRRQAQSLGVTVASGEVVHTFRQTDADVCVETYAGKYKGRYLVACDGARSPVRKALGIDFVGTEPEFTGYSLSLALADSEVLGTGRVVTEAGMYMQSQPGYVVIQDFDGGAFHASKAPITREHVQSVLRRVSGTPVTVDAVHLATTWTDRARQAVAYRRGRVLLAGDAAHIHAPLGGQGLNLGIGDAMNLGWKLAAVINGTAAEGLLDTYEAERQPVGARVLEWSRAQVAVMNPDRHGRALHAIVRDLIGTRDGATYFAGRIWGVGVRYESGDDHELVGASVPNFELGAGVTVASHLRDGRWLMLDFVGRTDRAALVDKYAPSIKLVRGTAEERFGLNAALVRPDGIVAWISVDEANERNLESVLAKYFVGASKS